jgi:heat shock protein HslJ
MKSSSMFWPCFFAVSAACGGAVSGHPADGADSSGRPAAADSAAAQEPMLVGTTWRLIELEGNPAPLGNDGRVATLELTLDGKRVAGFAGCNRMAGTYELNGDSLTLGPLAMTRMACAKGMELEQRFTAALEQTRVYRLSARGLELVGQRGSLARLEAQ